ncbi:MAG: hypothetical protein HZA89_13760 [Verrucomicrobia bacterium]|nr:hypothetical protein [Verrucomicrobiota bacterium]
MTAPDEMKPAHPALPRGNAGVVWIAAIFAVQAGFIWALSGPGPAVRPVPAATADALVSGSTAPENLPFNDPALFALSSPQGFSGPAWLALPRSAAGVADWNEPEAWMNTGATNWGGAFLAAGRGLTVAPPMSAAKPDARLLDIPLPPPAPPLSTLHVSGGLAGRRLLAPIRPRAWPHEDVLADTVVRLTVNADGAVQSAAVISHTGVRDAAQARADSHALELARTARFAPLASGIAGEEPVVFGTFIFQWSVVPLASPESPDAGPPPGRY